MEELSEINNSEQGNYFTLFGIPKTLRIEEGELRRNYLRLSRQFHPDMQNNGDPMAQALALKMSAEVAKGYFILNDTLKRGLYFLSLHHQPLKAQDLPADFLMEMMELNETLEELETAPNYLEQRNALLSSPIENMLTQFQALADEWEQHPDWEKLKSILTRLQYLQRMKDRDFEES